MVIRSHTRLCVVVVCVLTVILLGGCGIVSGVRTTHTVHVRVTEDFGARTLVTASVPQLTRPTGALALTGRFTSISHSGRRVSTIAGHSAAGPMQWTLYINGIEESGPNTQLHNGDHVWWDLHDRAGAADVPAIVGAYPEPFTNGSGGQTFPTVLTCASGLTAACDEVTRDLDRVGLKVSFQGLGTGSGSDSLAILIGTDRQLRGVIASELLSAGPGQSGVFARFTPNGNVLELDNAAGSVTQTLDGSYGVIAATEEIGYGEPVWLITGTDAAGVEAAARVLDAGDLRDHFAVAVTAGGKIIPLPVG